MIGDGWTNTNASLEESTDTGAMQPGQRFPVLLRRSQVQNRHAFVHQQGKGIPSRQL